MSDKDKKSTITPEHVLAALQQLGFSEFQGDLQAFYGDVKESNAQQGERPAGRGTCCQCWDTPQLSASRPASLGPQPLAVNLGCHTYSWALTRRALQASRGKGAGRLARRRAACLTKSRRGVPCQGSAGYRGHWCLLAGGNVMQS